MKKFPSIDTKRMTLTLATSEQAVQYHKDIVGTKIFDTILWDGPESDKDLIDYWQNNHQKDPYDLSLDINYALINKETNEMMGGASLRPVNSNHEIIDIGYALAEKFHAQGYATEAIQAMVNEAFQNRKAQRVFATLFIDNIGSRRVLEKTNFIFEGTLHHVVKKRGEWRDEWLMAITRPMWKKLKS